MPKGREESISGRRYVAKSQGTASSVLLAICQGRMPKGGRGDGGRVLGRRENEKERKKMKREGDPSVKKKIGMKRTEKRGVRKIEQAFTLKT